MTTARRHRNLRCRLTFYTEHGARILQYDDIIDKNWEEFNKMIDDVFAGKKITIKKFNK